jgi:hypothetical protein
MSERNKLIFMIVLLILILGELANTIWSSLDNQKSCAAFGKRVEASRVEHVKKLGCVAIMPDGRMLAEPK